VSVQWKAFRCYGRVTCYLWLETWRTLSGEKKIQQKLSMCSMCSMRGGIIFHNRGPSLKVHHCQCLTRITKHDSGGSPPGAACDSAKPPHGLSVVTSNKSPQQCYGACRAFYVFYAFYAWCFLSTVFNSCFVPVYYWNSVGAIPILVSSLTSHRHIYSSVQSYPMMIYSFVQARPQRIERIENPTLKSERKQDLLWESFTE
jgi:hypothetical protein